MKAVSGLHSGRGARRVGFGDRLGRRLSYAAIVAAGALLLAGCSAPAPAPTTASATPTPTPTPTLAPASCTWSGVRQAVTGGTLGQFAVVLTNTSSGTCVLNGYPTATLTGGRRGDEAVPQGTASALPAGAIVVPAGATAFAPLSLATTTDGTITSHCTDSQHTNLQLTPPGASAAISIDVSLLHPCNQAAGFGWAVYPIQAAMPSTTSFG